MTEIKDIKAMGNYVVLKMVIKKEKEELFKKNEVGLFLPNEEARETNSKIELDYALVHDIGSRVENSTFKVGDKVVFNDYDIKYVGSADNMFGIVKDVSVMAVYNT